VTRSNLGERTGHVAKEVTHIMADPNASADPDECQPSHNGHAVQSISENLMKQRVCLKDLHIRFKHWFTDHYDLAALDVALATAVVEQLQGDPVWLLLVAGASTAKTETVSQLKTCPRVHEVSTLTSEAALLSATKRDEKAHDATGGLLEQIGERGVLIIKDFTSILSIHPSTRGPLLAALREIYDGY
jgi:hypothetical protein